MKNNQHYDIFKLLLNTKSEAIVNELKQFMNKDFDDICIKNSNDISKISNDYQDFLFKITLSFSKLWAIDFECHQKAFNMISDSFESLLTKALNRKIFHSISNSHCNSNNDFNALLSKYSFVTLSHLGITTPIDYFTLSEHIKNLVPLCQYKSTIDKSICVINLCNYLTANYPQTSLILLLAYTIISSNIPLIKENILFLTLFRSKMSISSIEDYYINQLSSAIDLISNLENNTSFLSISHSTFESYCFEYEKKQLTPLLFDKSINEVENKDKDKDKDIKSPKVDNAIIILINKIFLISTSNGSNAQHKDKHDENNCCSHLIKKGNENESLLNIPITQLQNEFCIKEFKEMSFNEIEQIYKNYKILLKIIQSSNKNYEK